MDKTLISYSPEVEAALAENKPVVALESTVIAHGLPRPQNIETAMRLESILREAGVVPATVAVLEGEICVGLSREQIEFVGGDNEIRKLSIRDLPVAVAQKQNGGTTVASTSWIAHRAGLKVFSTGGIGGIHRGAPEDVSADLPVLASTSIIVVCSGAKIVLDLPATREWLETHGVTVVGFGCDEMPAFYSRTSGLNVDARSDSAESTVALFRAQQELGFEQALLVTVPVPKEFEVPAENLEAVLDSALGEAARQNISGRELTPFLLSTMAHQSKGATLRANLALLENNARVAAEIARAFVS